MWLTVFVLGTDLSEVLHVLLDLFLEDSLPDPTRVTGTHYTAQRFRAGHLPPPGEHLYTIHKQYVLASTQAQRQKPELSQERMKSVVTGVLLPFGIGCGEGRSWLLAISRAGAFSLKGTRDSLLLVASPGVRTGSPSLRDIDMPLNVIFGLRTVDCQRGIGRPAMCFICKRKETHF